ncbi:FAD/FMN-dependent dehydrogenase [Mycobacteroides abscessus subsp. abscessus]|nr:LLM class flavin-dependent oxidoreductase [Mycobacteroides abscessus subsp. abscessus]SIG93690.1 FAD/FMN-dependent dehydrogenase [Mycobacteroides abscessus subsp. abscessus]SIH00953.1 FAD/FMN-dependent dehydrogenase [Mycobacteroides abscessus subsp. abscessus]SIH94957.1 FAD/FMN-dependent dehydrogenase [Mycobacteroides abscessus subsp. abscessus]SII72521.1 FAD/FMN-dependent dehydrogenase [Mycobacteroides abscessus subsp. abscessus]
MNYGQPLRFGAFLIPSSTAADQVVERAQLCERLGYDLVAFPDRPPLPHLLEMWTLLSWIAARTSRIRLMPNVADLQLRDPVILARAAASLDLLSEGRIDLGLGASLRGSDADAMGGTTLDAVADAIPIIRGVLDADAPGPFEFHGTHHNIDNVQRGPLPVHRIPLWISGYRRSSLSLAGRAADGWIASLFGAAPEQALEDLHKDAATIDSIAAESRRDPADIRRLLVLPERFNNQVSGLLEGPVSLWVNELLPFVVQEGFSTLILATDDDLCLEHFAKELAPALREAVDRELPLPLPPAEPRPRWVLDQRRDRISYESVPASLVQDAIEPGDVDYARVRSTRMRGGSPGIILRPKTANEVADAMGFARAHRQLPLGIRSGGHGISGRSTNDGGIVIDLCQLNDITVIDPETRRVRIGPGATWRDVAAALAPYGLGLSSGDFGGVGVGGLTAAGGIGLLNRNYGLTIDRLRAAQIVLADGTVTDADHQHHPDLFWAIRGAAANFGVVTAFEFEANSVTDVGWAQFVVEADNMIAFLQRFGVAASSAPRDTTAFLTAVPAQPSQPPLAQLTVMVNNVDPDVVTERLQPFVRLGDPRDAQAVIAPYAAIIGAVLDFPSTAQGEPAVRSGLIDAFTPMVSGAFVRMLHSGGVSMLQVRTVGGAVADTPPDATAFAYRRDGFSVTAIGFNQQQLNRVWDPLGGELAGVYTAFESDDRPERVAQAYPPDTLYRLREIKLRYDPHNLFRDNFNIEPAGGARPYPAKSQSGRSTA